MEPEYSIYPFGDAALIVETAEEISESSYRRIQGLAGAIAASPPKALREILPAYRSILVVYDALVADYGAMERAIKDLVGGAESLASGPGEIIRIPVCYESPYCLDLSDVARHAGLSEGEVIEIHAARPYLVYMLGFTPGFPYLGGMSEKIATPRRQSPRVSIPAGSVGIADRQTGIYPIESPGGWNIIGRTPVPLFDPSHSPPALLRPGLSIRFYPIGAAEFERVGSAARRGEWIPEFETGPGGAR